MGFGGIIAGAMAGGASATSNIAQGYIDKHQYGKAASVIKANKAYVASTLNRYGIDGEAFADATFPGLGGINKAAKAQRTARSARGASEWRSNAAPVYQTITVQAAVAVQSPADIVAWVKKQGKLAALGRGLGNNDQRPVPMPTDGWGMIQCLP